MDPGFFFRDDFVALIDRGPQGQRGLFAVSITSTDHLGRGIDFLDLSRGPRDEAQAPVELQLFALLGPGLYTDHGGCQI